MTVINIFDNIIKNNKDLNEKLQIEIFISSKNENTTIKISNNLSPKIKIENLQKKIIDIKEKVRNYKEGNLANSFEGDSGYMKICRCISADLEQINYDINVEVNQNKYEVEIKIENKNLTI